MQKKLFILILFLAFATYAQENNSIISKQTDVIPVQAISVTIGGSFVTTGTYQASPSERVDQFITRIFNQARNVILGSASGGGQLANANADRYAKRNIVIKRKDGETIIADLLKFHLTGDFKYNPWLKNEDVIIIPEMDNSANGVSIEGAINLPLRFQFVEGDKLTDALLFARGINPAYNNVITAEISRLDNTGNKEEIIKVGISDDFPLKRGDRIRVLSDENNKRDYRVLVLGEVKAPGYIFITKEKSTIRDVIEKSGGFLENASLENSELLRGTSQQQILRMNFMKSQFENNGGYSYSTISSVNLETLMLSRMSDIAVEDSSAFVMDNLIKNYYSTGVVDFTKINDKSSSEGNFIVKDGDVVVIPAKENLVYIFGQVMHPGYITYAEGEDYHYYVKAAGGKGDAATGDVKIIKAKTKAWYDADDKVTIEKGDIIYLPKTIYHRWDYYLAKIGSVFSILGTVITIIYLAVK